MAKGGVIVVDDCDNSKDSQWDGAYQAYEEFCAESGLPFQLIGNKMGIIRK